MVFRVSEKLRGLESKMGHRRYVTLEMYGHIRGSSLPSLDGAFTFSKVTKVLSKTFGCGVGAGQVGPSE